MPNKSVKKFVWGKFLTYRPVWILYIAHSFRSLAIRFFFVGVLEKVRLRYDVMQVFWSLDAFNLIFPVQGP